MSGKRERKLVRKARRLAEWAKRHGYGYVNVTAMEPDAECPRWYAHVDARDPNGFEFHDGTFYEGGELHE